MSFLAHPTCRHERENAQESTWCGFWVFCNSGNIRILKQSLSALFCCISHMAMLFEFTCVMSALRSNVLNVCHHFWLDRTRPTSKRTVGAITFPPRGRLLRGVTFLGPSASRNTFSVSTITLGWGAAALTCPLRSPNCTSSRLRAEDYEPAGDQVDSDPGAVFEDDPHPGSSAVARWRLEPWVCYHTREPTVLSRVSCRPSHLNFDRFSPALPVTLAHSLLLPITVGFGRDRWGLSSPYHVATTYPFWTARLSLARMSQATARWKLSLRCSSKPWWWRLNRAPGLQGNVRDAGRRTVRPQLSL